MLRELCTHIDIMSHQYWQATERLGAQRLDGKRAYYETGESPSVWFPPTEVWEIRGADLTISPVHKVRRRPSRC